ncbi:MAG: ribbon-helix-helix domain-containing protein [Cyanobacteria bacterium J06638_38]
MNTSINIPDDLVRRLDNHVSSPKSEVTSRNAFIVKAIRQLLDKVESESNWCEEIMAWQGGSLELEREEWTGFGK